MVNPAKINFEVKNQYGEVMNVVASNVIATAYDKTAGEAPNTTGAITLSPVAGKTQFTGDFTAAHLAKGDEVLLTFTYKGLSATKTITVEEASALSTLELQEPQPLKDKKRITTAETIELPYVATDQYGEDIELAETTANQDAVAGQEKIGDWLFTSSNPAVIDIDTLTVNADGKATFVAGAKGTAKITAVNVVSGDITSVDVEVAAPATENEISLTAPNELVVAGETVKVPFTVYDQFGDVIKTSDLNVGNINEASSDTGKATVAFNADKELVITGVAEGTTEISATIGDKVAKFSIDVLAAAEPTKISEVKDVASILTDGAEASIKTDNIVIKDQYNRDYKLKGSEGVIVYLKDGTETSLDLGDQSDYSKDGSDDENANAALINADDTAFANIKGKSTAGSETLVFQLTSDTSDAKANLIDGTKFEYSVTTKAATDITSYTFEELPTLFDATDTNIAAANSYAKDLKVIAKDSSGNVVAIPSSDILSVSSSDETIALVDKASMKIAGKAKGTATITILVKKGDGSTQTLTQKVTVSDESPVAESVKFEDKDGKVEIKETPAASIATTSGDAKLVITDQYGGKELTANDIIVTTVNEAGTSNTYSYTAATGVLTVTGADVGDKFVLTAINNGLTDTLEVTIIAD